MIDIKKIPLAIVGMGAAGSMAGIEAGKTMPVQIFDANEKLGKKIYITGKGRCNFTNACPMSQFMKGYSRNGKFLFSALANFSNQDLIHFFQSHGLKSKVERGNRVFPVSNHSSDVNKVLENTLLEEAVVLNKYQHIVSIKKEDQGYLLEIEIQKKNKRKNLTHFILAEKLILACGGKSYPATGSRGEGYAFAKSLGHHIHPISPSLCPFILEDSFLKELAGLSLTNVSLKVKKASKKESIFGDLLFTHEGISGPIVLTMSSMLSGKDLKKYKFSIDWKPALDRGQLKRRLERERDKAPNRKLQTLFGSFLPRSAVPVFMEMGPFDSSQSFNSWNREGEQRFIELLKNFPIHVKGFADYSQAIVCRGGVDTKEIDPSTMESKISPGLYFAGEMIDYDGFTGGYNLQAAFSTGFLAGKSAASAWLQDKGGKR